MSKTAAFAMEADPLSIMIDSSKGRVELTLRGPLEDPRKISEVLTKLSHSAEQYSTCIVYINSPGGDLTSLVELLGILKKYKTVFTVASGGFSSAGFILWCAGMIRVVQDYSIGMLHREAYGYIGKTAEHADLANATDESVSALFADYCLPFLTEEEESKIEYTEVYFSANDLVERGVAITWDEFIAYEQRADSIQFACVIEDHAFVMEDETYTFVRLDDDTIIKVNLNALLYTPSPKETLEELVHAYLDQDESEEKEESGDEELLQG